MEWKLRVGRIERVQFGATVGFTERWMKRQLDDPAPAITRGPWLDVNKEIWCVHGGEITRLSVANDRWWTVAVGAEVSASIDATRLLGWIDALPTAASAHSYASWLTELCRDPKICRAAA